MTVENVPIGTTFLSVLVQFEYHYTDAKVFQVFPRGDAVAQNALGGASVKDVNVGGLGL